MTGIDEARINCFVVSKIITLKVNLLTILSSVGNDWATDYVVGRYMWSSNSKKLVVGSRG